MADSKYVVYENYSPNHYNGRYEGYSQVKAKINRYTPHCMAYDGSVESCGGVFARAERNASSNYGIGSDGRVGQYVAESNGSWCSSNMNNDMHSITCEIACDPNYPYKMSDKAIEAYINLTVDCMLRNGNKKLLWLGTKEKSEAYKLKDGEALLTVHRFYAAKACPGDYFMEKIPYIVKQINLKVQLALYNEKIKKNGTSFKVKTTKFGVRLYDKLGGKLVKRYKKGQVLNVSRVAIYKGEIWGKGLQSKKWFRMKNTKAI